MLKELIESTNGRFFQIEFVKKNGELRHMTARLGVHKYVKGVGMSYDPASYNLMTVWDSAKKNYRMVNLNTVTNFSCGSVQWKAAA